MVEAAPMRRSACSGCLASVVRLLIVLPLTATNPTEAHSLLQFRLDERPPVRRHPVPRSRGHQRPAISWSERKGWLRGSRASHPMIPEVARCHGGPPLREVYLLDRSGSADDRG